MKINDVFVTSTLLPLSSASFHLCYIYGSRRTKNILNTNPESEKRENFSNYFLRREREEGGEGVGEDNS